MHRGSSHPFRFAVASALCLAPAAVFGALRFGSEQLVAAGGVDVAVPGYSVPSFVFWNGDSLRDLVVGEGGGGIAEGKVRVYINAGTPGDPQFHEFFYAQSNGADLASPGAG
ncbi:MAG: hypothetical protein C4574_01310 [Candidatus Latescibacterota bacterium]|jgi:hypothetical protein|nr:MAG: hypothetical protein C4574_01310 [Candidatus Latescibacterota bacterium]